LLTHGSPLGFAAFSSRFKPSAESFTAVVESSDSVPTLFGQILHRAGDRFSRLNFLVSDDLQEEDDTLELWEYLCCKAVEMQALSVLAELEENDPLFGSFRKCGFSAYGSESAWKFTQPVKTNPPVESLWKPSSPTDDTLLRSMFQSLVPPIVQSAEPFANGGTRRLVYHEKDEIIAYVESSQGPAGIYLKPLIHPAVSDVATLLADLASLFTGLGQPVYLQVRSYQAWLLNALQAIGGENGPQFTLLVKHLAITQRNGVIVTQRKLVHSQHAEPTTVAREITPPIRKGQEMKWRVTSWFPCCTGEMKCRHHYSSKGTSDHDRIKIKI
ncbi:MAG: hypothetical protein HGA19_12765, partial [Oscillochloris sp.]|nr:hypothetical protein [Oscillochloris sp.]